MSVPVERPRRLRRTEALRRLARETRLTVDDLILPLFVAEAIDQPRPIVAMPGVVQETERTVVDRAAEAMELGLPAVVLFGVPAGKDAAGSTAWQRDGIVQRACAAIRERVGDRLLVIADTCLDAYTDHGHCGVLGGDGQVDNDATLEAYVRTAVSQAAAGADVVAPSGMMDGQVAAIREGLDAEGHPDTLVLAYAAKFASALYGPFREAAGSTPRVGDRRGYQLDVGNRREAVREVELDCAEGADMVMVKPALTSLDVLAEVRGVVDRPLGAFCVSGEYAMLRAAGAAGSLDEAEATMEVHLAIRRAGADFICTYHALELGRRLCGRG
ncbi:MAG TPA: porphobilinogen synthase [Candidatus Micrarchaeia archaeon]|nr:porphobilinogen synthase [Candidatus Micrarchaeia archaeon]